jgi:hypothetical protein
VQLYFYVQSVSRCGYKGITEMIDFSLDLLDEFPDKRYLVCLIDGLPIEIDTDHISNVEFDDTNGVVHFEMDEKTAQGYGIYEN